MEHPKTVKVVDDSPEHDLGYKVINRDDLTEDHILFGDDAKQSRKGKNNKAEGE